MGFEKYTSFVCLIGILVASFLSGCNKEPKQKLFYSVPPSKSKLSFQNNLSENVDFNLFNYYNYYNGAGVALGDINNDGLLDIYFSSNMEENKLFLNKGNLKFEDISLQSKTIGSAKWSTGVTMVDINADGLLDIYVCNLGDFVHGKDQNELFINNGDFTFSEKAEEYGLDIKCNATQASFFDYDNDGDLDMYLLNHSMTTLNSYAPRSKMLHFTDDKVGDRLYQNQSEKGIVKFKDVTQAAGILSTPVGFGLGIGCSDINNDGFMDIYVSNDFHENDYLYINQKDGTFKESLEQWMAHTSKYSMGNDIADFNNDGLVDIVTMDMLPNDPEILQKSMEEAPFELREIILKNEYFPQLARNNLQLNRGGKFSEIAPLAGIHATDWSWAPLIADLDNDGFKDLYVANGIYRRPNDLDYLNYVANGVIKSVIEIKAKKVVENLIKAIPQYPVSNFAYKNNGELSFADKTVNWGLDIPSYSNGATYGDLDNDGDLDLVVNNINQEALLLENKINERNPDHSFLRIKLEGKGANTNGIGAKVIAKIGDKTFYQEQSVTRGFMSSVSNVIHLGLGNEQSIDSLRVIWPLGTSQVLTNVSANNTLSIKEKNAKDQYVYQTNDASNSKIATYFTPDSDFLIDNVHQENSFNDIDSQYLIPRNVSTEGPGLAVGDVNGDGLDDVFVTNAKHKNGQLYIQNNNKGFIAHNNNVFAKDSIYEGVDALFFDVDQDNDLDLYVASAGNEYLNDSVELSDRLYINDGDGNFNRNVDALPAIYGNTSCVESADFDNDGDLDLFVGGRVVSGKYGLSPESYVLENNGKGKFKKVQLPEEIAFIGMVTDAKWVDYNGDGWSDLVVVGEWMPITLIKNNKGSFSGSSPTPIENTQGWWNSIICEDFDNDGDLDFMAGNVGLNTRLKASVEEPVHLYLKDFDSNGSLDQIMTHYLNGEEYPFATKELLSKQLIFLKKKFNSYTAFSGTTFDKLIDTKLKENMEVKLAKEFQSLYIENIDNQSFKTHTLPVESNFSPVRAIVSKDVNNDGLKDVVLAGNFYDFNPGMGRQDAGMGALLMNNGNNNFSFVEPCKSGINLSGQIREMSWLKSTNGDSNLLIAKNNEELQILKLNDDTDEKKVYNSLLVLLLCSMTSSAQELFKAPSESVTTRWISPENPNGKKGKGGQVNKGAKGNAFYIIPPGETKTIMEVAGAGIIQRMWMSGSIARNPEQRRAVIINMYWDGSDKPAVSAPIGDFFGIGLGLMAPFDSELFSNPEGRSFNFTIPMPYRDGAKIEIVNEASSQVLFWYDINYLEMKQIPVDAMYFHTYWNRDLNTELGKDFEILPKVFGKGRYLGTNVGVIGGHKGYINTWFGEGEVKIYLDGDTDFASLVGTGTEDYIGTGWGQGEYYSQRFGSLVVNKEHDVYAFYRYHTADAVFFKEDCKVNIQQMGNGPLKDLTRKGVPMIPVWYLEMHGQKIQNAKGPLQYHVNLLDSETPVDVLSDEFPDITGNYYRSDDVSATAYFYLMTPESNLPSIQTKETRLKNLEQRVWNNFPSMKMGM